MPRFIVKQTFPCYVTWSYEIEAADEDEAMNKYYDGEHDQPISTEIGDSIEWAGDGIEEVQAA